MTEELGEVAVRVQCQECGEEILVPAAFDGVPRCTVCRDAND